MSFFKGKKLNRTKRKGWWMNISDKIDVADDKFCPPHYLPHKLPVGDKIVDEKCHVHQAKWRMAHHNWYCQYMNCPHFKNMSEERKKYFDENNNYIGDPENK